MFYYLIVRILNIIVVYYSVRVVCSGVFYRYTQKLNGVRGEKKTIEISTGGGRTRTDRRTPYALAEQQRWSVVAVVTDSSVVV